MAKVSFKGSEELDQLNERVDKVQQFFNHPRFRNIQRPYTARQVAPLQPSIPMTYPSQLMSQKLYNLLEDARQNQVGHPTLGAMDTVQASNYAKYLETIYVSGWQCSSTASSSNDPGPDFADYPANTVPNKVDQLFKGLLLQDRSQNQSRSSMTEEQRQQTPKYDYLTPIIADADAGFGGITSAMKLTKMMIESGAAGIHIEDQRPGNKKCGHMGGKVVVSTREHVNRLIACRLQADIMQTPLVICARTDSLSAKLIDSNVDKIDHPFILGLYENKQCTFVEAGIMQIQKNFSGNTMSMLIEKWQNIAYNMSLQEAQKYAKDNGFQFDFDWEALRSCDGFYALKGCVELCAARAKEFLKYADMIWMETPSPSVDLAAKFAKLVKQHSPEKFLGYNLSPSFNWSAFDMSDKQIQTFSGDLGKLGYVWQFITLAGFHFTALKSEKMAKEFSQRKMISYVEKVQRKEDKHNVDQLTHQRWSGSNYVDAMMQLVDNKSATLSTSSESTENQFKKNNKEIVQKQLREGL